MADLVTFRVVSDSSVMVGGKWRMHGHIHTVSRSVYEQALAANPGTLVEVGLSSEPVAIREVTESPSSELLPAKKRSGK